MGNGGHEATDHKRIQQKHPLQDITELRTTEFHATQRHVINIQKRVPVFFASLQRAANKTRARLGLTTDQQSSFSDYGLGSCDPQFFRIISLRGAPNPCTSRSNLQKLCTANRYLHLSVLILIVRPVNREESYYDETQGQKQKVWVTVQNKAQSTSISTKSKR